MGTHISTSSDVVDSQFFCTIHTKPACQAIYLFPSRLAHAQVTKLALDYTTIFRLMAGKSSQSYYSINFLYKSNTMRGLQVKQKPLKGKTYRE